MSKPIKDSLAPGNSTRIAIESCKMRNWKQLKPLILDCFDQFEPAYVSYLIRTYWRATRIAYLDTRPAGFQMSYRSADGKHVWLENIGTAKSARQAGVAIALLDDLERIAGNQGFQEIVLAVDNDNSGAIKLYERLGYLRRDVPGGRRTYAKSIETNSAPQINGLTNFTRPKLPERVFYRLAYPVLT